MQRIASGLVLLAIVVSACSSSPESSSRPSSVAPQRPQVVVIPAPELTPGPDCASAAPWPALVSAHPGPVRQNRGLEIVGFSNSRAECWKETAINFRGGQDVGYKVENQAEGLLLVVSAPLADVWLRTWNGPYDLSGRTFVYESGDSKITIFSIRPNSKPVRIQSVPPAPGQDDIDWKIVVQIAL